MFRMSHWARAEELVPLLTKQDQTRIYTNAVKTNLDRKTLKRFRAGIDSGSGLLRLEDLVVICYRYSEWATRRRFDWGKTYPAYIEPATKAIDNELTTGIWTLDVDLRREVEALLKSGRQDAPRAMHLRNLIEGTAGSLAAALRHASTWHQSHAGWEPIAECYNDVCNDLDYWLTWAGAPATYDQDEMPGDTSSVSPDDQ